MAHSARRWLRSRRATPAAAGGARHAVSFFFVLSGFVLAFNYADRHPKDRAGHRRPTPRASPASGRFTWRSGAHPVRHADGAAAMVDPPAALAAGARLFSRARGSPSTSRGSAPSMPSPGRCPRNGSSTLSSPPHALDAPLATARPLSPRSRSAPAPRSARGVCHSASTSAGFEPALRRSVIRRPPPAGSSSAWCSACAHPCPPAFWPAAGRSGGRGARLPRSSPSSAPRSSIASALPHVPVMLADWLRSVALAPSSAGC